MNRTVIPFAKLSVLLVSSLALSLILSSVATAQSRKFEQLKDLGTKEYRGPLPTQGEIETAYKNCLVNAGEDVTAPTSAKGAAAAICKRSKLECISNPRSVDCKMFVDDYAV